MNIYFPFLLLALINMANGQILKVAHCYDGCPNGAEDSNHLILRPIYALSYNMNTKSADWVAYKLSPGSIGIASSLSREAVYDNYVEDTLKEEDFLGSEELGLLRSQYVSIVDFAGTPFWRDVNYLTNSIARTASLSQGAWYGLDWSIRNYVNRQGEVYVVTGPIFDAEDEDEDRVSELLQTDTAHRVPDKFFKVVVNNLGQSAAFILSQSAPVHVHHCEMIASIEDIEKLTGLDLFSVSTPKLDDSVYSDLGCR